MIEKKIFSAWLFLALAMVVHQSVLPLRECCYLYQTLISYLRLGNFYSIANQYEKPARVFFAQGCYMEAEPTDSSEEVGGS